MGEISFNYNIRTEPVHETAFKYWFSESIEYGFMYQRYIAFSDTSIFNSPVVITKVAAGLSQLYDLFVDKKTHYLMYEKLIKNFNEVRGENTDTHIQPKHISETYLSDISKHQTNSFLKKEHEDLNNNHNHVLISKDSGVASVHLKEYWLMNTYTLNVYENPILKKLYENKLNVYSVLSDVGKDKYLRTIIDKSKAGALFTKELNVYDTIFGRTDRLSMNIVNSFALKPFRIGMNILDIYFGWQDKFKLNVLLQTPLEYAHDLRNNIIEQVFGKRRNLPMSITENVVNGNSNRRSIKFNNEILSGKTSYKNTDIKNILSANNVLRYAQLDNILSADKSSRYTMQDDFVSGHIYSKLSNIFKNVFTLKQNKSIDIFNNIESVFQAESKSFYEQQYSMRLYKKSIDNYDSGISAIPNPEYCFVIDNITTTLSPEKVGVENTKYQCIKSPKTSFIENNKWISLDYKKLMTSKNVYTVKQYKKTWTDSGVVFDAKNDKVPQDIVPKFNVNKIIFADKINKDFRMYYTGLFIDEKQKPVILFGNNTHVSKISKDINIEQYDNILIASKTFRHVYSFSDLWFMRKSYNMSLLEQFFVGKETYDLSIYRQIHATIKRKSLVPMPDFDFVIKNNLPIDNHDILFNGFAGVIIPLSKIQYQAYVDNINLMVQRLSKEGYLSQNLSASVIHKNVYIPNTDLFCDKQSFNAYLDYKNIQITKSKVYSIIHKDKFATKNHKHLYLSNQIWLDKSSASVWYDKKEIHFEKQGIDIYTEDILTGKINPKNIYCHNSLFVDKLAQMCYYSYNVTLSDKSLDIQIHNQLTGMSQKQQSLHALDCVSSLVREQLNAFYDYGIFVSKLIQESNLFKQIQDVNKIAYNAGIRPEDFGNWVWVYEDSDPFIGLDFGIDELLLPENDTRYENFEDIIFDKQNMRPKSPVKQIDENTFIAKYPIRHPLPDYSNIAVDYNKSAIKAEQFYGIETSIMHTVFLKFYRIWQNKIFEFGTMTMVQSVKSMLEYLYTWIMEYFPIEELEQALRVFKLIRWYGESSIIQNSQYVISYEYGILESKLNTGACLIPNDLETNDTMYVDAKLGVIRNNPTYVNQGVGAYVTFEINNKKNTTFTFSLSNTVGSVYIYINDVLVDTVSKSALNLTYELPYTGDTNIVKIEKTASHNLNGNFYIGNIKVPNCTFKNLSIEFDPTLKAGNKPLNEIAKKMIAYANLYENREEVYEIIQKGNLGIEDIYKRLTEYWELHHQNKTKGKRLTIKEV
ncbi:MAG: hypothetical protein IJ272_11295 [Clostridia bacterium]|nr:hypothetical protein [Clostridia bacterium]